MDELDLGWQQIVGKKPILVVAAHNFSHGREGVIKFANMGTGDLARKICEKYNYHALVSTRAQLDPNWYSSSNFREKIKEIIVKYDISLIIDLHGKKLNNKDLIELNGNTSLKRKFNLNVDSFKKNQQLTLAEELDKQIPVLQVEIREDGRVSTIDGQKYLEAWQKITGLLDKLNES